MNLLINNIFQFLPEFLFITFLSFLLVLAIINKAYLSTKELILSIVNLSIISLIFLLLSYIYKASSIIYSVNFLLKEDILTNSLKIIIVSITIIIFILSKTYFKNNNIISFEIPLIILFSLFGILTIISSNDLMLTYLALEMQSLSIYAIVASRTTSNISVEAGLKYFILGSFISGFILYGISLVYLTTGTTNIQSILMLIQNNNIDVSNILTLAVILLTAGFLFKLSAAPLHNWTPDVFDGAPTIVTAFIATAPKIAIFYLIVNILATTFNSFSQQWSNILMISGILSLIVGCFGGLYQTKIKRLLAYSTINNMGFVLLGLSINTQQSIVLALFYIIIYVLLNIGIFSPIILFNKNKTNKELIYIRDFKYIYFTSPIIALILALNIFSLAGLPPLAGFFTKLFLLFVLVSNKAIFIAVLAVVISVITSFYYIRLIKILYFSSETWNNSFYSLDEAPIFVIYMISLINLYLIFNAEYVLEIIRLICI